VEFSFQKNYIPPKERKSKQYLDKWPAKCKFLVETVPSTNSACACPTIPLCLSTVGVAKCYPVGLYNDICTLFHRED
jgi:hypothetical protein